MKPAMPASARPAEVYHREQFPHSLGPNLPLACGLSIAVQPEQLNRLG